MSLRHQTDFFRDYKNSSTQRHHFTLSIVHAMEDEQFVTFTDQIELHKKAAYMGEKSNQTYDKTAHLR